MGRFLSSVQVEVRAESDVVAIRRRIRGPAALVRGQGWLGVYSEEAEQDMQRLETLAADLSRVAPRAIVLMVHDSDFVWMSLAEGGRIVDRFSDCPDESVKGDAGRWGDARLRQVWNGEVTFAEDKLGAAAEVLGIPLQLALASADELPEGAEWIKPEGAPAGAGIRIEPAPVIAPPPRPVLGEQFGVQSMFRNAGAAFTGMAVEVSGGGLNLITLRQGHAFVAARSIRVARDHPAVAAVLREGAFHFSQWAAPAGETCGFSLLCEAVREGADDLIIRLTAEGGETLEQTVRVEVAPAPRRPLRFLAGPNAYLYLKQLHQPRVLSGVAILHSGLAADLMAYLREWVGETEAVARTIKRCAGLSLRMPQPKKHRVDAAGWNKLLKAAGPAQSVVVETANAGALLQYSLKDVDGKCPHLAFWSSNETERERLRSLLESLVERDSIQAFLTRWDWTPEFDCIDGFNNTPYEMACGAGNGKDYMSESWCTRYLRAVGEETWLGPQLQERAGAGRYHVAFDDAALSALEQELAPVLATAAEFASAADAY